MSLPANALTTVAAVAAELGITPTLDQSTRLERMIGVASDAIENYCSRKFGRADLVEAGWSAGGPVLTVERTPVVAVSSITVRGGAVDAAAYDVDSATGVITRHGVEPEPWPDITCGEQPAVVAYSGGYLLPPDAGRDLPYDLEQAAIDTVVSLWRGAGQDRSITGESVGGASVQYSGRNAGIGRAGSIIPDAALVTLEQYRRAI